MEVRAKTIAELRHMAVDAIYRNGAVVIDERGERIKELINMHLVLEGKGCDQSKDPLIARLNIDFAEGLISDNIAWLKDALFHYSYGAQMRKDDMLYKCIDKLRKNPSTRRAYIPILHPYHVGSELEIPCCVGMDLKIRDGKLIMTTIFRSNEMFIAAQSDIFGYRSLQKHIAFLLRVEMGEYHQISISAHIRESDMNGINKLLDIPTILAGPVDI